MRLNRIFALFVTIASALPAQGGNQAAHWSFITPKRKQPPRVEQVRGAHWPRNEIDHFVLAGIQRAGLQPSKAAAPRTLARRLSLDLTGLPPTPEVVEAFARDPSDTAYETLVDQLLASPHYGERMAAVWLDAARYSDSDGFQQDAARNSWPWRDWVVDAYNENMPFDRFTTVQLAGDLLPNPRPEDVLATCFQRNHMTNGEGGRDPEESRIDYVMDRVNTLGTTWLGLTLGCAQCHDHKYDPVSQEEYFRLNAFFNSIAEDGRAGNRAKPYLKYRSSRVGEGLAASETWLRRRARELATVERDAKRRFDGWLQARAAEVTRTPKFSSWNAFRADSMHTTHGTTIRQGDDGKFAVSGPNPRHDDFKLAGKSPVRRVTGLRLFVPAGEPFILTNLKLSVRTPAMRQVREVAIRSAKASYEGKKKEFKGYGPVREVLDDDPRTGWSTFGGDPDQSRIAVFGLATPLSIADGQHLEVELRHRSLRGHASIREFRIDFTDERGPTLRSTGATPLERLAACGGRPAPADRKALLSQFLAEDPRVQLARSEHDAARRRRNRYAKADKGVDVMVLRERAKPRTTHVLEAGIWDRKGRVVAPGVPAAVRPWPEGRATTRLSLARYLVDGRHPLVARVAVNRYWQMYFGHGIVRTPEDFGRRGKRPTHPDLLDWLACEFVTSGWNVKAMQKRIVMSATYRQSSHTTPERSRRDPENQRLARMTRFRMPSWMIRDSALAVSGLLQRRRGGPPVFPHQPPGYWADSTMGRFHYRASVGDDVFRRSIYGFWRRTVAPTAMFDAAKRRTCQTRVVRTNTPQHALTVMNDRTFVEAARGLAHRAKDAESDVRAQIRWMFQRVLLRQPDGRELERLHEQLLATRRLLPARERSRSLDLVASTILNLDEALTRE